MTKSAIPFRHTIKADKPPAPLARNRKELGQEADRSVGDKIRIFMQQQALINVSFASAPSQNEFLAALIQEDGQEDGIDWSCIRAFYLDEYIGLPAEAPQSFGNYLKGLLFDQVPIQVADFKDPELVKKVQLDLASRVQQVHDKCFESLEQVPEYALTLTIPALLRGKHLFCMVPGTHKADAIQHTLVDDPSEKYPATILRSHADATLFIDQDSAGKYRQATSAVNEQEDNGL